VRPLRRSHGADGLLLHVPGLRDEHRLLVAVVLIRCSKRGPRGPLFMCQASASGDLLVAPPHPEDLGSALLATVLWPLILVGVHLHLHWRPALQRAFVAPQG
jgi:hypothetical protein